MPANLFAGIWFVEEKEEWLNGNLKKAVSVLVDFV